MIDETLLFIYGTAAAVVLIAIVAYYYMPTLVGATQAQAEYAILRDAAPTLILAQDGKSVHVCINSTAPQRVLVQRSGVWVDAQKDCRINPGGQCVSGGQQSWPFCRWYLDAYRPGDDITITLKTDRASVVKSYRIVAIAPSVRLRAPDSVADGLNATGGQNGTQVVVITMTGTVYSITTVTVTTTVTFYNTTTVTVTAPAVTVTHTVAIYDPSFTTTRTLTACMPDTTTPPTPTFPPIEMGRYGFQLLSATTSTVTSYTTIYTTSYVTSTFTTTAWTTSTLTYTPTVTTTITSLRPGVAVTCYICQTPTPTTTCSTTTLVTTTSTTTITGGPGSAQPNASKRGLSIDAFFFGLSAVAMMVGSVMLAKKR